MGEKVLTDSEVLEILYNQDESFRDSNSDSVSNSDIEIEDMAVTEQKKKAVIFELLEPLLGRGHTLWIYNFFNSPELARKLIELIVLAH